MTRYLGTVLPGLEAVATDELRTKLAGAVVIEAARGKVYFECAAGTAELFVLRTLDNLYRDLGVLEVGPHKADLPALGRAAALAAEAVPVEVGQTVWVNASRVGTHTYSRFEAAETALAAMLRRSPRLRLGTARKHDVELRLDVEHERARLALRLTDAAFRFRGAERAFSAAALRPPVAHALVWLTQPAPTDLFLDPFCGSATIVAERATYEAVRVVGSDTAAEALAAARANVGGCARVELHQWDARLLPLEARSVDAVATNLPFGRQVGERDEMAVLYRDFARELQRVLVPRGVAIVLTELPDVLTAGLERTRLFAERVTQVSLKGLRADVLRLSLG